MNLNFIKKDKLSGKNMGLWLIILLVGAITLKVIYDINSNSVISVREEYEYLKETISLISIVNSEDYVLQRINEKYKNSNIEVYYPVTKYDLLNNEVKKIVDAKINKFKEEVKDEIEYSLFINFDMYRYKDYYGFVFHVLVDFAGAHPNTNLFSVNYNSKDNKLINIDTLVKSNNNILNLISKYSYNSLVQDEKIKELNMPHMLKDGTAATKTNYDTFVFGKEGLIVFFEKYQVAPYAYGEFSVNIPYVELNLKIIE